MTRHALLEPSAESVPTRELGADPLAHLQRLIRAIEDELTDEEIDDEQKLQNIGERVAGVMDGR